MLEPQETQETITLQTFFNTDFVNYSSYDNLRKIAQIDGLKNAQRKIIYTLLEKNIREPIKVSQLGAKICEFSDYLHGNLDNVIVTLAQDYAGTNNLPLVQKKGNFGTRFSPDASASRYIFACGSKVLFELFKKEDRDILIQQEFEGYRIEPQFYLPTLPILLINGSEGVSTGFAQKILPRNPKLIKEYLLKRLQGVNPRNKEKYFVPYFQGFTGTVEPGEGNQWLIKGSIERISKNKVQVNEVPVGYNLKSYIQVLDKLEDQKLIVSYRDLSDNDKFKFMVQFQSKDLEQLTDDEVLERLKLIKKVTENFTILDENNQVKVFNNSIEIMEYFIEFKLKYMTKRKEFLLKKYQDESALLKSKLFFIMSVINGKIVINKKTKNEIISQLKQFQEILKGDNYNYLLKMPLWSLTQEKIKELAQLYKDNEERIKGLNSSTESEMFLCDIEDLDV